MEVERSGSGGHRSRPWPLARKGQRRCAEDLRAADKGEGMRPRACALCGRRLTRLGSGWEQLQGNMHLSRMDPMRPNGSPARHLTVRHQARVVQAIWPHTAPRAPLAGDQPSCAATASRCYSGYPPSGRFRCPAGLYPSPSTMSRACILDLESLWWSCLGPPGPWVLSPAITALSVVVPTAGGERHGGNRTGVYRGGGRLGRRCQLAVAWVVGRSRSRDP